MRLAVVHPYPVHSRAVGGVTRVMALVRHFAERHRVTVLAHSCGDSSVDRQAVADLARLGVEQEIFTLPRPAPLRQLSWVAGSTPYYVRRNRNPALEAQLTRLAREGLDVVHVERAHFAPMLTGLAPRPVLSLAEQETMSLAVDRLRQLPWLAKTSYERYLGAERNRVRRFEAAALPAYDLLYAITPQEAERMSALAQRPVEVLPHVVCPRTFCRSQEAARPGEENTKEGSLLFVGNYAHRPNLHALTWFVERVWPEVARRVPTARFEVVGPGLAAEPRRALQGEGVHVLGRVEDLVGKYRASTVMVNPIRSGGGMRGKVLEAFACQLAVVSTPMGMEGIAAESGRHCLLASRDEEFTEAVVRYLGDANLRRAHGAAARCLVEELYTPPAVFSRLEADFEAALAARRQTIPQRTPRRAGRAG